MTWRTALGFKPTPTDLALDLIKAAERHGLSGWQHHAENSAIRNGDQVINLANFHLEYAGAPKGHRRILLQKYFSMLQTPPVSKLWSLAQTKIYPLLRSRYDRVTIEIDGRRKNEPIPPRAGRRLIGNLDQILGYDHGASITQVKIETLAEWGVTLETAIDRAMANLRALPPPRWHARSEGVWQLESPDGYTESLLQVPRIFGDLPARGTPLAMIPNRGVLLATGSDEPNGLTALLSQARVSLQEAPWPLNGELFQISPAGIQLFVPSGNDAKALASIQRIDISSVYAAQKTALEVHVQAIEDVAFVATFSLFRPEDSPHALISLCAWTAGISSLLPVTDKIALVRTEGGSRDVMQVSWTDAQRLVGHYFKETQEDPPRIRVDEFPTPEEWTALKALQA
jgi:hypothetical protein